MESVFAAAYQRRPKVARVRRTRPRYFQDEVGVQLPSFRQTLHSRPARPLRLHEHEPAAGLGLLAETPFLYPCVYLPPREEPAVGRAQPRVVQVLAPLF